MNRLRSILLASLAALAVGLIILVSLTGQQGAKVRARYAEMTAAISSGDTNAVLALVAPQHRKECDELRLMRMEEFAKPLGPGSKIVIVGRWPRCGQVHIGIYVVSGPLETRSS